MWFFSRMCRAFQASMMGLSLSTYSGRLPKWGLMLSGDIYELQTLERHTAANDGSLWPTARATMGSATAPTSFNKKRLEAWAVHLWPTPRTRGLIGGSGSRQIMAIAALATGDYLELSLMAGVQLWTTPAARDWKGARKPETLQAVGRNETNSLPDMVRHQEAGQLNPD